VPFQCHHGAICFAVLCRCAAVFQDEPVKHLAEDGVGVFHPPLLVCLFEDNRDQIKEHVDEHGVHVDNVVVLLQRHPMGALPGGTIVRVDGAGIVGHVGDISGEGITINRVSLVACIMFVEVGVDRDIQQVHLLGDGGFVHLGAFAHVLQEIVEDK
jgi:hypothetical protein